MSQGTKGYIKLYRDLQDCWIWQGERFTRGQAWVDLLLMANHRDTKIPFGDHLEIVARGQFITSISKLADKWGWSFNTVKKFLNLLESDNMLTRKSDNSKTLITIVNYGIYQANDIDVDRQVDRPIDEPIDRPIDEPGANLLTPNKNEKNDKEDNNNIYVEKSEYEKIRNLYNDICKSLPKCTKLSGKRLNALKTRFKTYSADDFRKVFEKAEASDFLSGRNGAWGGCGFDWLIIESNMIKVLEGNYDNKQKKSNTDMMQRNNIDKLRALEERALKGDY